jgi:hypothetical protein
MPLMSRIKIIGIIILTLAVIAPKAALADWKVYYTGPAAGMFGSGGRGSYDNRSQCEAARNARPAFEQNNSHCSGFDTQSYTPSAPNRPNPASSRRSGDGGAAARGQEEQRQLQLQREQAESEMELARQKKFAEEKDQLMETLKGADTGTPGLKNGTEPVAGLELMGGDTVPEVDSTLNNKPDMQEVRAKMAKLQRQISGIQILLRGYSRTLQGNSSEFEKWEETVNKAYDSVLDNSKEYLAKMFLKYNLLGALERSVQKSEFEELGAFLGSNDPAVQGWLVKEMGSRRIQLSRLNKVVDVGNLSGDFASLLTGGEEETKRNLDALLFVNDLLETGEVVKYEQMLEKSKIFKTLPSDYFEQATMIGETYADLTSISYSWFSIHRLNKQNEQYAREIASLSYKMKVKEKEMQCLKLCLETYTDKCMDTCAGKTKFSMPPPLPN